MPPSLYLSSLTSPLTSGGSETTVYVNTLKTLTGEQVTWAEFSPFTKGYIIVDPENQVSSQPEIISFTGIDASSVSFTGCTRGLSAVGTTTVAANKVYHGTNSPVIISWGAQNINDLLIYVNSLITGVAGNASSTVAGVTKLTQDPAVPTSPIAVGANTSASGTAISTTNKALDAAYVATLIPTGTVWGYSSTSAPSGWLLCDGSAVSRTTYATLFGVISTTFGSGDGSSTFNVPDYRGRALIGTGTGTKVATFASRSSNVITVTGLSNTANNEFQTGQAVVYHTSGSVMTGLSNDTTYYIVRTGNLTFSLASSLANAQNGTVVSLSSDGSGTQTFTLTLTARSLGNTGGEENHAMSSTELLAHTHATAVTTSSLNTPGTNSGTATSGNTGSTGGNAAMNIMQPFGVTTYIIKY